MRKTIQTAYAPQPRGHYSQAVRTGQLLFISGQLPIDRDGNLVNKTLRAETVQILENIRAIVEAAGGTIADIVQCTVYIDDISMWSEVNDVYGRFFQGVPVLPARAVVPVKELHYNAHIEIQAIAVMD
jgi:2-iminobutanoate/2-iminopropanoate deaminase